MRACRHRCNGSSRLATHRHGACCSCHVVIQGGYGSPSADAANRLGRPELYATWPPGGTGGGGRGGGRGPAAPATYALRSFEKIARLGIYSAGAEWEFRPVERSGVVLGFSQNWQERDLTAGAAGSSWLAGFSHQMTNDLTLRASATHKIRFPSIQQLYDEATGNMALAPERAYGFEGGAGRTWGTHAQLDMSVFSTHASHFIEREAGARFRNQDRCRFAGMEATFETRAIARADVRVAYGLLVSQSLSPASGFAELQYRPRHRTTIDTRWALPGRMRLRTALHYVADQVYYSRSLPLVQAHAGDYALINLSINRPVKDRYDIVMGIDNLFDQLYEQAYGLPREGRAVLLTLRGRF